MAALLAATIGTKGQITLPKKVREFLGVCEQGDLVGFSIDEGQRAVRLAKLKVVPEEEFTEGEYQKLLRLPKKKGGKRFTSMQGLLKDLKAR
jgi:AbrB family looped-hinge helix DNA binding protein